MRKSMRIDVIVRRTSLPEARELVNETQTDQVLVRVDDLGRILCLVESSLGGGEEPLLRPCLRETELQRVHPGRAHELDASRALDVHRPAMRSRTMDTDATPQGRRQPAVDNVPCNGRPESPL